MKYLTKDFTSSDTGIPMMARIVRPGEGMGRWDANRGAFAAANEKDDLLVEFWDRRYKNSPFDAQFISRYNLDALKEWDPSQGLCLDGGIPAWSIGPKELSEVMKWAERIEMKLLLKSERLISEEPGL